MINLGTMKIPTYIKDLMSRAEYEYDACASSENYAVGYTVRIEKSTRQQLASTFQKEIEHLIHWVNTRYKKLGGIYGECGYILSVPNKTQYKNRQYAVVTILDPVMKYIENYMPENQAKNA